MEETTLVDQGPNDGAVTGAGVPLAVDAPGPAASGDDRAAELAVTIEAIRPALQADGGDMQLVSVDPAAGRVDIELIGACGSCPASTMTLRAGIERILMERLPWVTEVNALGMEPVLPPAEPVERGLGDIPGFGDW